VGPAELSQLLQAAAMAVGLAFGAGNAWGATPAIIVKPKHGPYERQGGDGQVERVRETNRHGRETADILFK
jgi:hypothetical protein